MDAAAYRQFVELEERHFWFVGRRRIFFTLLDAALGPVGSRRVLDVGCGAGGMLEPLSRYGAVRGIDTSPEMVAFCRERGFPDVEVGSATEPLGAGYDLITLFDTIEHVAQDDLVLRRCREALAPGGLVCVSVPAYQLLFANNDRVVHHQRRYTARRLRGQLRAAGLEPVRVTYFNALLFPAILPIVLAKKALERVRDPGETTNLSAPVPGPLNRVLTAIMSAERHLVIRAELPFGHSIVALARRS
ncbi:MAG: methyltransferase domain-containing protein [Solirubrobacteraceae bacterium]